MGAMWSLEPRNPGSCSAKGDTFVMTCRDCSERWKDVSAVVVVSAATAHRDATGHALLFKGRVCA